MILSEFDPNNLNSDRNALHQDLKFLYKERIKLHKERVKAEGYVKKHRKDIFDEFKYANLYTVFIRPLDFKVLHLDYYRVMNDLKLPTVNFHRIPNENKTEKIIILELNRDKKISTKSFTNHELNIARTDLCNYFQSKTMFNIHIFGGYPEIRLHKDIDIVIEDSINAPDNLNELYDILIQRYDTFSQMLDDYKLYLTKQKRYPQGFVQIDFFYPFIEDFKKLKNIGFFKNIQSLCVI